MLAGERLISLFPFHNGGGNDLSSLEQTLTVVMDLFSLPVLLLPESLWLNFLNFVSTETYSLTSFLSPQNYLIKKAARQWDSVFLCPATRRSRTDTKVGVLLKPHFQCQVRTSTFSYTRIPSFIIYFEFYLILFQHLLRNSYNFFLSSFNELHYYH